MTVFFFFLSFFFFFLQSAVAELGVDAPDDVTARVEEYVFPVETAIALRASEMNRLDPMSQSLGAWTPEESKNKFKKHTKQTSTRMRR